VDHNFIEQGACRVYGTYYDCGERSGALAGIIHGAGKTRSSVLEVSTSAKRVSRCVPLACASC